MTDYDDYEAQQRIERVERGIQEIDYLAEAMRAREQRDFGRAANNAVSEGIAEALKEAGLSQADWGRVYFQDPQTTLSKQKQQAKRFAQKIIRKTAKAGKERNAQGRFVSQQQAQPAKSSVAEAREAQKAGRLSSDQALERIVDATLGDFFKTLI